jgi:hypothetical protein
MQILAKRTHRCAVSNGNLTSFCKISIDKTKDFNWPNKQRTRSPKWFCSREVVTQSVLLFHWESLSPLYSYFRVWSASTIYGFLKFLVFIILFSYLLKILTCYSHCMSSILCVSGKQQHDSSEVLKSDLMFCYNKHH